MKTYNVIVSDSNFIERVAIEAENITEVSKIAKDRFIKKYNSKGSSINVALALNYVNSEIISEIFDKLGESINHEKEV